MLKGVGHSSLRWLHRFLSEEDGQATVEYILLLSVTLGFVITFVKQITSLVDKGVLKLGGQLEKDLKTGRATVNVWSN